MIYTAFIISLPILILAFGWVCYGDPAISSAALTSSTFMRTSEKKDRINCSTTPRTSGVNSIITNNHNMEMNASDEKNRQLNYYRSTELITNDLRCHRD